MAEGNYDLQLFLHYGDGRQIIERKTVEVGDEFVDPEDLDYIEIEPAFVEEELRRGGAHTESLEITNRTGDPIGVQMDAAEIESDYERSVLNNFELELRGDQQFELEGRRSERPVLIARAPREDITDGGYYDNLQFTVVDPDTGEELQTKTMEMAFTVGEDFEYDGVVQDITTDTIDDEVLFSATTLNTGEAHFTPQVRVYLKQEGEIQHTIFLDMPEEERILPGMTDLLTTHETGIEPGEYTAEVTLQYAGEDISVNEFELEIAPAEEE